MTLLIASVAGAAGAVCRYAVSGWVQTRHDTDFPTGTLAVNVVGSFGLGVVVGAGSPDSILTLVAVGFLGGFTTFSTWMVESIRLGPGSPRALLNLTLSLGGGVTAAVVGFILTN
jgi:CrcB protein